MLKAGPPDVAGSLRGQECRRYVLGAVVVVGGGQSRAAALPASLLGCLSVSSASLPPYTLSHFSPMSLPDQGGGDVKKKDRERKKKGKGKERLTEE